MTVGVLRRVFLGTAAVVGSFVVAPPAHAQAPYLVKDINPGSENGAPFPLYDAGGMLLFGANNIPLQAPPDAALPSGNSQLWKSDGTEAGTTLVKNVSPYGLAQPGAFTRLAGKIYFDAASAGTASAVCREMWTTDGTAAGTVVAASACPDTSLNFSTVTVMGGRLYFRARGSGTGSELWTSDGTQAGTRLVRDVWPGPDTGIGTGGTGNGDGTGTGYGHVAVVGGKLIFAGDDGTTGLEPWATDGTAAGTALIAEVTPGARGGVFGLIAAGPIAFFYDANLDTGESIWRTDGTAAGTIKLGSWGGGYALPGILGGSAFFDTPPQPIGIGATSSVELWKTDGSPAGTVAVKTFTIESGTAAPLHDYVAIGSTLFFTATTVAEGEELWKTDGTSAGTVLVKDIRPGAASSSPTRLFQARGTIYFAADDGVHGYELWRSDGTGAGTVMVGEIVPGSSGGFDPTIAGQQFIASGSRLFFQANDTVHGIELWAIDIGPAAPADGGTGSDGGGGGSGAPGGSGAAGGSSGVGGSSGAAGSDGAGGSGGTGGTGGSGSTSGAAGVAGAGGTVTKPRGGCGCALAAPRTGWLILVSLTAGLLLARRRRSRA